MMKTRCDWGRVYEQPVSGVLCISPNEIGRKGRYIFPEDFVQLSGNEWALREDETKTIKIEQL